MKTFVAAVLFFDLCLVCLSDNEKIKVRVYSQRPGTMGQANVLICRVSNFDPPVITVDLLKNGQVISETLEESLTIEDDWYFHFIKKSAFTPQTGDTFACRVTYQNKKTEVLWVPEE